MNLFCELQAIKIERAMPLSDLGLMEEANSYKLEDARISSWCLSAHSRVEPMASLWSVREEIKNKFEVSQHSSLYYGYCCAFKLSVWLIGMGRDSITANSLRKWGGEN